MFDTLGPWLIPLGAAVGALGGWLYSRVMAARAVRSAETAPTPLAASPESPAADPPEPTPVPMAPAAPSPSQTTAETTLAESLSMPLVPPRPSDRAPIEDWIHHAEILDFDGFASESRDVLAIALDRCASAVVSERWPTVGEALTRAIKAATSLADQGALARAHALLGRLAERSDDTESAHQHYLTALELYENRNDRPGIGATCELLARLHARQDDPEGAEAYWRYGLSLATARGDREEEARILGLLGRLASLSGDLEGAEEMFREAMTLEEALGHPLEEGFLTADLARLEQARGNEETARALFDAALARLNEAGAASEELTQLHAERNGT